MLLEIVKMIQSLYEKLQNAKLKIVEMNSKINAKDKSLHEMGDLLIKLANMNKDLVLKFEE